jgi:membrane associated rhomboid family serine protease
MAIVLGLVGQNPDFMRFTRFGGVVAGRVTEQPWRLLSSLFIHADPSHVFWNGLSMLVFAVPVILDIGYLGAAVIYLAGGVVGGIAGASAVRDGVVLFGSSGAVSALFGAWVAITLLRARRSGLPRRARVRVIGLALLILPSLVSPMTSSGQSISVAAHLGGMAAGFVAGLVAWRVGAVRPVEPEEDDEDEPEDELLH